MLEAEILKLEEMVKNQHKENIELKQKIQNVDYKVVKTYEEEFKKAKLSLSKLLVTAQRLEEDKKYLEASEIYEVISSYFPGTYEAFQANQRIPTVISKIKKR